MEHDLLDDQDNAHYLGESLLALDDDNTKKGKKKRDMANLRKAPNAPKRFKSSYICFFMENQSMIKKELGDEAGVTSISKRSAEKWKSLSVEERVHWEEVAAKDKQRYLVEKSQYTGPWQVPWKRVRKDPSAPKRPMSAFLYYSQVKRSQLKVEHPDVKNTDISRMLGELWRQLPEQERSPHVDREKIERDKYKIAIAAWREENARTTLQVQADHALMYGESFESQHASMMNAYTFPGYHACKLR